MFLALMTHLTETKSTAYPLLHPLQKHLIINQQIIYILFELVLHTQVIHVQFLLILTSTSSLIG